MDRIFEITRLDEIRDSLTAHTDRDALRRQLISAFLRHSQYSDATGWNAAVRICESLAIIGWGEHEPLEAIRGKWFNGNPETYFINRDGVPRFFDAVWSRRSDGLAIDYTLSFLHGSATHPLPEPVRIDRPGGLPQDIPLQTQRNWIPKNPIRIIRGLANCYPATKPVIGSINNDLIPELNRRMRPELYGTAIDAIIIDLSFSFYDNYHCKTNHIIADESLKLRQKDFYPKLLEMFSEKEIADNGYYLRNRFAVGPFRKETGKVRVDIVFEKEFSQLPAADQKRLLSDYMLQAVHRIAKRLQSKISYDFQLLLTDFQSILDDWQTSL